MDTTIKQIRTSEEYYAKKQKEKLNRAKNSCYRKHIEHKAYNFICPDCGAHTNAWLSDGYYKMECPDCKGMWKTEHFEWSEYSETLNLMIGIILFFAGGLFYGICYWFAKKVPATTEDLTIIGVICGIISAVGIVFIIMFAVRHISLAIRKRKFYKAERKRLVSIDAFINEYL